MKYLNSTGRDVLVRFEDGKGSYLWKVIVPGGVADIPADYAERLGFVPDTGKPVEAPEEIDVKHVEEEIDKIKGIGKKRSKQINKVIEEHAGAKSG